jgi:hypothetical protein
MRRSKSSLRAPPFDSPAGSAVLNPIGWVEGRQLAMAGASFDGALYAQDLVGAALLIGSSA